MLGKGGIVEGVANRSDVTTQSSLLNIKFSICIVGSSTHTDTMKAAAYEIVSTPAKRTACEGKQQ